MNTKIILTIVILSAFLATSCDKEYLNTQPTSTTDVSTIFKSTEEAKLAINGLAKIMSMQYFSSQGMNGEGTIKMYYGNYPGAHFTVNLPSWAVIINQDYYTNLTSVYDYYPWYYYYRIVGNANTIIANIEAVEGPDSEKEYIKAQALSYRAYAFMMLAQLYCLRWPDSDDGAALGLILRLEPTDEEMSRSTLAETYQRIYDDLTEAIALFTSSGIHRDNQLNYVMDIEVAYAIYARAALNREDYATAATMAAKARENYPLMDVAAYQAGFANPTSEWIWSVWGSSDETLYFYSYFAYIAYNSSASAVRTYPKCISKELFDKIPGTDIRKDLFLDPADYPSQTYTASTGQVSNAWRDQVRSTKGVDPSATVYIYMQLKIKANDMPGVGNMNIFRSSEMYLIEAEAKYFNKDISGAQQALIALNKNTHRDDNYTCTLTGSTLLDEIKTYRGLELWGEGFDWFDLKRWGDPLVRKSFADGGSFVSALAVTIQPNEKNKWTWFIPAREVDYNKLAQQNNYSN
jgi:hypothetical protein